MTINATKVRLFAAIILLVSAYTFSVSAQIPTAVNRLTAKADPISEMRERNLEKKSLPPAKGSDLAAAPEEPSEVSSGSEVPERITTWRDPSASPQPADADSWQFQLTPYLWIPTISGQAGIGNMTIDTTTSVGDSDVEINFGFMGTFEARKNRFIILADLQYSDLASEKGNPGPLFSSSRASFKTFVLDPEVGYRLLDNGNGATLDVLGGLRYWHLDATLAFSAGILPATEVSRSRSWIDGVAGLRGKAALSQRWFVVGKADLGGGGSKFTYQLFGGVGVNLGKRVALIGGYRDLNVNYDNDGFLFDMSLHGPNLGIGFRF